MKIKCTCLLIILLGLQLAASPNRYFCNGLGCAGKQEKPLVPKPASISMTENDEPELLPYQYFLNHI